jgi:hypothetical protein
MAVNLKIIELTNSEKYNIPNEELPQIRLHYPLEHNNRDVIWQGGFTKENIIRIIDSPARREIVKRIQEGNAATWILLESRNPEKNTESYKILDAELRKLSNELQLATSATDVDGKLLDIDIINRGVSFSMVKVSRNDFAEEIFIKMLLGTEPDLPFIKAPLAFPVFGRGRVLFALVGKGINGRLIKETCNSVIGWCSCTIKEDNPGSDLLLKADWEIAIGDSTWIQELELPEITGISGFISNAEAELKDIKTSTISEPEITVRENINIKKKEAEFEIVAKREFKQKAFETNNEVIEENKLQTKINESKRGVLSTLNRNILIVVILLLILLPTISFFIRKKSSNN